MFDKLNTLIENNRFTLIDLDAVEHLRAWAASAPVIEKVIGQPRLIYGDLTAEQVFVISDGYKVIDWQRPVIAPSEVDLVTLLVRQKIEPRQYVDPVVVGIYWFLHLRWVVEAQYDLFPEKHWAAFDQWAAEAINQILRDA